MDESNEEVKTFDDGSELETGLLPKDHPQQQLPWPDMNTMVVPQDSNGSLSLRHCALPLGIIFWQPPTLPQYTKHRMDIMEEELRALKRRLLVQE